MLEEVWTKRDLRGIAKMCTMDLLRNNEIVIYETHGMMEVTILKMRYERHE